MTLNVCVYTHTHIYIHIHRDIYTYVCVCVSIYVGLPMAQMVKNLPAMQETRVQSLGQQDPLENGMAAHFNFIAWRIL